jgi:hypothetical protein
MTINISQMKRISLTNPTDWYFAVGTAVVLILAKNGVQSFTGSFDSYIPVKPFSASTIKVEVEVGSPAVFASLNVGNSCLVRGKILIKNGGLVIHSSK